MYKRENAYILADGRWQGQHGIGRFATEILMRLRHTDILKTGPAPLSLYNLLWQPLTLVRAKPYRVFFNPGFNPIFFSTLPYVITLHDLIHVRMPTSHLKRAWYATAMKYAAKRAYKILTVSAYSKQDILNWIDIPAEKIDVIGNGVSAAFTAQGECYQPGFPYLLHVGNAKPHKNIKRLLMAFAAANIDSGIKLMLTSPLTETCLAYVKQAQLEERVVVQSQLSEHALSCYYRGALGVVLPSLYEGFGLPVIEGMACGVPVLTSAITALPEIAGNAAIYVNPYDVSSIANGMECLVHDERLRAQLINAGFIRAGLYTWDKMAAQVQQVLER